MAAVATRMEVTFGQVAHLRERQAAVEALRRGRVKAAQRSALRSIAAVPYVRGGWEVLCDCAPDEAVDAVAGTLLALSPQSSEARVRRARHRLKAGRPAAAWGDVIRALATTPGDAAPWEALLQPDFAARLTGSADRLARQITAVHPERRAGWYETGIRGLAGGSYRASIRGFTRAVALSPGDVNAWINGARCLGRLGRPGDALRWADMAVGLAGPEPRLAHERGRFRFETGALAGAVSDYRRLRPKATRGQVRVARLASMRDACAAEGGDYRAVAGPRSVRVASREGAGTSMRYGLPETFVAEIGPATVLSRPHAVLTEGGRLVHEQLVPGSLMAMPWINDYVYVATDGRLLVDTGPPAEALSGRWVLFGGDDNFSHGVNDYLSKLWVLRSAGLGEGCRLLISERTPPAVRALLPCYGFDPEAAVELPQDRPLRVERLVIPSMAHRYPHASPDFVRDVRRRLARPLGDGARPRIYLSRGPGAVRRVLNEPELQPVLDDYGVRRVTAEALEPEEQWTLFSQAELVMGPLGGAFAAILMAPRDAAVVELTHDRFELTQYEIVARMAGQPHRRVVGSRVTKEGDLDWDWHYRIEPDALAGALDELVRPSAPTREAR